MHPADGRPPGPPIPSPGLVIVALWLLSISAVVMGAARWWL